MNAYWRAPAGLHVASARLPIEGELPSFDGATGWLNSEPLIPAGLRGKVVLVDFWTYTCINWLRQLPYLRAWAEKYSGHGLVVIGVHTPEFSFEHDVDNVRRAVQDMRIDYPVATDNDYAVWSAFGNHYWRALLRRRAGAYPVSPLRQGRILPAAPCQASRTSMPSRRGWGATSGPCRGTGSWPTRPPR
jgi:thiol-disulfide isomerase/thioredoxin